MSLKAHNLWKLRSKVQVIYYCNTEIKFDKHVNIGQLIFEVECIIRIEIMSEWVLAFYLIINLLCHYVMLCYLMDVKNLMHLKLLVTIPTQFTFWWDRVAECRDRVNPRLCLLHILRCLYRRNICRNHNFYSVHDHTSGFRQWRVVSGWYAIC